MKYVCQVCGYVYDDDKEKTPFDQLPDTWKCPLCGAPKSAFKAQEEEKSAEKSKTLKPANEELNTGDIKLSVGQLAALCSNLEKG